MRFFSPPAIVEQVENPQKYELIFDPKPEKDIDWPMVRYALFHAQNKHRGPDGRTYNEIEDGKYLSSFVSQYAPQIYDNIEPGVLPLVKALHDKGYLTFGSCQSHSIEERRWVGLVFHTEAAREEFRRFVRASWLPIHFYTDIFPWDHAHGTRLVHSFKPNYTREDSVTYWNIMYGRAHPEYFPLLLLICGLPYDEDEKFYWSSLFRSIYRVFRDLFYFYILKRFFVDAVTKKLAKYIEKKAPTFSG